MKQGISVIIPAYNEAKRIKKTINALSAVKEICQIIVVDDGSSDETGKIAASCGAQVITMSENKGKGTALNQAVRYADNSIVAFIDADLEESAYEVKKLIQPVISGQADMTVAVFPKSKKKSGFGLVKKSARWLVKKYGGVDLKEPLSGQRVVNKKALEIITPFSEGFGMEIIADILAARNNIKIVEVPVKMSHRVTGRNIKGFIHRGKQLLDIIKAIFKMKAGKKI